MIKRGFQLVLAVIAAVAFLVQPAPARGEGGINVIFTAERADYLINEVKYDMDVSPFLQEGAFYVPLRFAAQGAGVDADSIVWDPLAKKVTLNMPAGTLEFTLGSRLINKFGTVLEMDQAAVMTGDRVMVPLNWLARALELDATWNPFTATACLGNASAGFYYRQGYDFIDREQYELAVAALQKAVGLDPAMARAYAEMGYCYNMLGQYQQGIEACGMALGIDTGLAVAYSSRAFAYRQTGYTENAIRDYTRAIAYGLERAVEYNNRGSLYLELELYNEAWYDFNRAALLDPAFPPSYFNRGFVYYLAGDLAPAADDFRQAASLDEGNRLYQDWLTKVNQETNKN
ncbi:MAG: stalk domain-containing protein [Desulfotomaculaceae bacterium]|nr:stalk domain-containing protein [Desulfotomaculaceae bacterium]